MRSRNEKLKPWLRILHKLTESHIALNPSQGMRVNLAVQVGVILKIEINNLFYLDAE